MFVKFGINYYNVDLAYQFTMNDRVINLHFGTSSNTKNVITNDTVMIIQERTPAVYDAIKTYLLSKTTYNI